MSFILCQQMRQLADAHLWLCCFFMHGKVCLKCFLGAVGPGESEELAEKMADRFNPTRASMCQSSPKLSRCLSRFCHVVSCRIVSVQTGVV